MQKREKPTIRFRMQESFFGAWIVSAALCLLYTFVSAAAFAQVDVMDMGDYGSYGGYGDYQDVYIVPMSPGAPAVQAVPSGGGGPSGSDRMTIPPLDQPLIPEEYTLSPGDTCALNFWGRLNTTHKFRVTPDGTVFIPEIGIFKVAGKTLSEFRAELEDRVAVTYVNVSHHLQITTPHTLKVKIYGHLKRPGWYHFSGPTRASEAIEKAGGILPSGSSKNVIVTGRDRNQFTFNMHKVTSGNKDAYDPYLKPGEMLFVPVITWRVEVAGQFIETGSYEISAGESLLDIIKEAKGPTLAADFSKTHILRNGEKIPFDARALFFENDESADLPLEKGDVIIAPKLSDVVYVVGSVIKPGPIEYDPGFTLIDYIGKARGPQQLAALQVTTIVRGPPDNVTKIVVDYRRLLRGDSLYKAPAIERGDIIVIPRENAWGFDKIYKTIYGGATTWDILK